MTERKKDTPSQSSPDTGSREDRLAKALRDNLRRRKAAAKPGKKD